MKKKPDSCCEDTSWNLKINLRLFRIYNLSVYEWLTFLLPANGGEQGNLMQTSVPELGSEAIDMSPL
jgi:hypothetical protein